MFLDNPADKADFAGLFATHPPIEKRIAALVKFAGGRDEGPWGPTPLAGGTAVPTT
jgi:heat shock protein HtpX